MMKRFRPDFKPSVYFLCMTMESSDKDDWKNMWRLLDWVKDKMKYKRVISASFIQDIFTWVNSAYDVHTDMQSQSGGAMSIEWGVIHANPGK